MRPLTSLPLMTAAVAALCSACAARAAKPSACEPVPAEFALPGQTVYRDCSVDKKARPASLPSVPYNPSGGQTCARAVVDVVVDSAGLPVTPTARVVRTTDPSYALAVVASLDATRYEPAVKDGQRVPQLVRIEQAFSVGRIVVPAGTPPSSARPPRRRPSC